MARPPARGLTENELLIMRVLWERAPLSIGEILEALPRRPKPAYNSVLTLVRILEQKGHVKHHKEGKAYYYAPVLDPQTYRRFEVKKLVTGLFEGNVLDLAVSLIKSERLSDQDRVELKRLLEEL